MSTGSRHTLTSQLAWAIAMATVQGCCIFHLHLTYVHYQLHFCLSCNLFYFTRPCLTQYILYFIHFVQSLLLQFIIYNSRGRPHYIRPSRFISFQQFCFHIEKNTHRTTKKIINYHNPFIISRKKLFNLSEFHIEFERSNLHSNNQFPTSAPRDIRIFNMNIL